MDYLILTLTGWMLKLRAGMARRSAGAAFGATCYCMMLFLPVKCRLWGGMGIMLITAVGMGRIVFSLKQPKSMGRFLVLYHAAAFFLGGTVTAMYQNTRLGYYLRKAMKGDGYAQIAAGALAGLVLAACLLMKIILVCVRERRATALYYKAALYKGEKKAVGTALYDTGNHLKEPVSHKPVIVTDMILAGELLDERVCEAIKSFYQTGNLAEAEGIRLIPFHSVGRRNGILAAVFIDKLVIEMEQENIVKTGVCVAIAEEPVSVREKYHVILNAELVEMA